jgi:large subunit ribosomal protein L25
MVDFNLQVNYRNQKGRSYRRQLARRDMIPGVVYGREVGSIPVEVGLRPLKKILSEGANALIDLTIKGFKSEEDRQYKVLIKDIQYGPVRHDLLCVDLHQIALDSAIQTTVPINFTGAVSDGIEQYILRELQVSCLPTDIPREINVNIEGLTVGDTITVRDIEMPDNVQLLDEPDATVVTVVAQRAEELPDEVEAETDEGEPDVAGDETPA